jgi:exonuclease VII small subunit
MANAIMDLVLMGLLLAALAFGVRLDKRLKALRAGQEAFAQAVRDLDDAAIRAHNSLKELRANADESQELLHGRVIAAREALKRLEGQIARAERAGIDIDKSLANWETMSALRAAPARPGPSIASVADAEAPRPFRHDVVRPSASAQPVPPGARRSQLPPAPQTDDADMLDKVQMSELVVANLNEMIRSLNHPGAQRRRMPTVLDDELFGDNEKR